MRKRKLWGRCVALALSCSLLCGCASGGLFADEIVQDNGAVGDTFQEGLTDLTEGATSDIELGGALKDSLVDESEDTDVPTLEDLEEESESVDMELEEDSNIGSETTEELEFIEEESETTKELPEDVRKAITDLEESNSYQGTGEVEDAPEVAPEDDVNVTKTFTDKFFLNEIRRRLGLKGSEPIMKSDCEKVTELSFCLSLSDLIYGTFVNINGIENFTNLESLRIDGIDLDNKSFSLEDYPSLKNIKYLYLSAMSLEKVNLEGFEDLISLDLSYNAAIKKTLDISPCKNLTTLNMYRTAIEKVVGLESDKLVYLDLSDTCLDTVDVSKTPNLQYLNLNACNLQSMKLGNLSELWYLDCGWNQFSSLDISGCPNLVTLNVSNSLLTKLNVSGHKTLGSVNCDKGTKLEKVDVSNCANLQYLDCSKSKVMDLNTSGCKSLQTVLCNKNYLRKLSIPKSVTELDCTNNYMSGLSKVKGISSDTCKVKFSPQKKQLENPAWLMDDKESILKGQTRKLYIPELPKSSKVTYKSSNPKVIKVDKNGTVKAKKSGTSTITIKTDGGYKWKPKTLKLKMRVFESNLPKPVITSASLNNKKVKVSWKKVKGAEYYQIRFDSKKSFKTCEGDEIRPHKSSYKFKMNRTGKAYIKIRYLKYENGYPHYSKWSKVVKVGK